MTPVSASACAAPLSECQFELSLATDVGSLWAAVDTRFDDQTGAGSGGTLDRLNPRTGTVEQRVSVGGDASAIREADGDLWVLDDTNGVVTRLHPHQSS